MKRNKTPDNFAIFILTHGRPETQFTLETLRKSGWRGKTYLVIDNEDRTGARYKELYGDMVLVFDKAEWAERTDEVDAIDDRRAVVYARNAVFELAERVGVEDFMVLDDDYTEFQFRFNDRDEYEYMAMRNFPEVLNALLRYYRSAPQITSLAIGQGGDFIGGKDNDKAVVLKATRKVMNSFICSTKRPFDFMGRINEDVNAYVLHGSRGKLFLTTFRVSLVQRMTQTNAAGLTDIYQALGTYVKSMYSVVVHPSGVKVGTISMTFDRLHHVVDWDKTVPQILREEHRRE